MQSYPGGIESGTDWYQNDAGVVLTETTIRQTPFNAQGTPVAFRARQAIQYGGNIDEVVQQLGTRNNGLYTNEWLIGDAKTNEIAMYELGTDHTKLWRSSKNEWFGNTPGFYWGNNNAKDLAIRLEYHARPAGRARVRPVRPDVRDLAWQELYTRSTRARSTSSSRSSRSAPRRWSARRTMDAKVITADMANKHDGVGARSASPISASGCPAAAPRYAKNDGLYPERLLPVRQRRRRRERGVAGAAGRTRRPQRPTPHRVYESRLWKGWMLPASDADTWFAAGSAAYHALLQSDDVEKALEADAHHVSRPEARAAITR